MLKYKKITILALLFTLLISTLVIMNLRAPDYGQRSNTFKIAILKCKENFTRGVPCFENIVKKYAPAISAKLMVITINKLNQDRGLDGKCHEIMHAIGVEYYDKDIENLPLAKICGAGFIHGMLQAATIKGDKAKVTYLLDNYCRNTDHVVEPSCTHGMGHDLRLEGFQDIEALANCEKIMPEKEANYQALAFSCLEGFYMQDSKAIIGKTKTGRTFYMATAINPIFTETGRAERCSFGLDLELKAACKVILYRFSYPNYFLNPEMKDSVDFPKDYIKKQCNLITKGLILNYFCHRQAGVLAFAYSEMTDQYNIDSFRGFCSVEMEIGCLGSYFEQIATKQIPANGVSKSLTTIMKEICSQLASKESEKCIKIAEQEKKRN